MRFDFFPFLEKTKVPAALTITQRGPLRVMPGRTGQDSQEEKRGRARSRSAADLMRLRGGAPRPLSIFGKQEHKTVTAAFIGFSFLGKQTGPFSKFLEIERGGVAVNRIHAGTWASRAESRAAVLVF